MHCTCTDNNEYIHENQKRSIIKQQSTVNKYFQDWDFTNGIRISSEGFCYPFIPVIQNIFLHCMHCVQKTDLVDTIMQHKSRRKNNFPRLNILLRTIEQNIFYTIFSVLNLTICKFHPCNRDEPNIWIQIHYIADAWEK